MDAEPTKTPKVVPLWVDQETKTDFGTAVALLAYSGISLTIGEHATRAVARRIFAGYYQVMGVSPGPLLTVAYGDTPSEITSYVAPTLRPIVRPPPESKPSHGLFVPPLVRAETKLYVALLRNSVPGQESTSLYDFVSMAGREYIMALANHYTVHDRDVLPQSAVDLLKRIADKYIAHD